MVVDGAELRPGALPLAGRVRRPERAPFEAGGTQLHVRGPGRVQLRLGLPPNGPAGHRVRNRRQLVRSFAEMRA